MEVSPQSVVYTLILIATVFAFIRRLAGPRMRVAIPLFWCALLARLACSTFLNLSGMDSVLAGDGGFYDAMGRHFASSWDRDGLDLSWAISGEAHYSYVFATLYYFAGDHTWVALLTMAVLGALTAVLTYLVGAWHFGEHAGRWAGIIIAFLPSSVMWTSLMLKEAPNMLAIILCLGSTLDAVQVARGRSFLAFGAGLCILYVTRKYLAVAITLTAVLAFLIVAGRHAALSTYLIRAVVGLGLAILVAAWAANQSGNEIDLEASLKAAENQRVAYSTGTKTGYLKEVHFSTPGEALAFIPLGIAYFLLSPFPWEIGSVVSMLSSVEVPPWYVVFAAALCGAYHHRHGRYQKKALVLSTFVLSLTIMYALVSGNTGTAMRHRTQLLPAFALLGGLSFANWFRSGTDWLSGNRPSLYYKKNRELQQQGEQGCRS
jgi:4-amino-4-deoxy-L-arabinose transferase-like glycosyltransferase